MLAAPAVAPAMESAPAVAYGATGKQGRAEGTMKAPPARAAKKARQDAFDPMDPVSTPHFPEAYRCASHCPYTGYQERRRQRYFGHSIAPSSYCSSKPFKLLLCHVTKRQQLVTAALMQQRSKGLSRYFNSRPRWQQRPD